MKQSTLFLINVILMFSLSVGIVSGQRSALLIIDIQEFYFPGGDMPLNEPEAASQNAGLLLEHFRASGNMVIHIRHNYVPGGNIQKFVAPREDETVISKDFANAFRGTNLETVLKENSITDLVICGMQTHMCVEAAIRAGSDKGFNCTLIEDACATRTLQYQEAIIRAEDVHNSTLASLKSYARIMTTQDYLIADVEVSGR